MAGDKHLICSCVKFKNHTFTFKLNKHYSGKNWSCFIYFTGNVLILTYDARRVFPVISYIPCFSKNNNNATTRSNAHSNQIESHSWLFLSFRPPPPAPTPIFCKSCVTTTIEINPLLK